MKVLNKVVPAMILPLVSPALVADTEFGDTVPREVVMQFVGGNPLAAPGRLYSDILADFPDFEVPDGFSVLASADQGYSQRVILRTELDEMEASAAVGDALTDAGWSLVPEFGQPGPPQTGFIGVNSMPRYQQFCHDDLGNITVSVVQGAAPRYVNLNRATQVNMGNQPTCAQRLDPGYQQFGPPGFGRQGLSQYVPRLVMPMASATAANQPRLDAVSFASGGGGGSNDYESRGSLQSDMGIDDIAQYFIEQIEQQGWAPDSKVTGSVVASGSWTKTIDDMDLVGTLLIVQQAENTWDLRFRVLRTTP